jgi:uncharacterized membrane protein (UPF0127 family)
MAKNIVLIIIFCVVAILIYRIFFDNPNPNSINIKIKDIDFSFEVAKSIPQKTKGLMDRDDLCQNCGMIFVSGFEMPQVFWMKNTKIPLDIIFLDKNGVIINIQNATPEPGVPDSQLKLYKSTTPAQYVIEINSGEAAKLSLTTGDKIDLANVY